jgi:hypothetical protein
MGGVDRCWFGGGPEDVFFRGRVIRWRWVWMGCFGLDWIGFERAKGRDVMRCGAMRDCMARHGATRLEIDALLVGIRSMTDGAGTDGQKDWQAPDRQGIRGREGWFSHSLG